MGARDIETSLWLHNKLGTSNDQWSGKTIVSQLNQDLLKNIRDCFTELQPQVKLKILLSCMHIARRNVEEWRNELNEISELAVVDSDQWVSTIAELLKTYPNDFQINLHIEENSKVFTDLISDLKKLLKRSDSDRVMLPMECLYLNKNAMTALVGSQPLMEKHFTLIRKPKSAALRAELLQRSSDASSGRRSVGGPIIPIRCRGLTGDSTPLRGISTKSIFPVGKSSSSKSAIKGVPKPRDGGIKLLDIAEQPLIAKEAKRRKKTISDESLVDKDQAISQGDSHSKMQEPGLTPERKNS